MDLSDSENTENDSDIAFLDDDEDLETDVSTEVDGEVSSHSDSSYDPYRDVEHAVFFSDEDQNDDLSDTEVDVSSHSDSSTDFHQDAEPEPDMMPENQILENDIIQATTVNTESSVGLTNPSEVAVPSTSSSSTALAVPSISIVVVNLPASDFQVASTSSPESIEDAVNSVEGAEDSKTPKSISTHESPRGKKRKKECGNEKLGDSDGDGQICSICMDEWSNSGTHRMCCLKCGHIYGESCIRRWLTSAAASSGRCPQCNAKAKIRDIRPLFARALHALDTAERDRLATQLEEARREKERLQLEVTRITMSHQMQQAQVGKLQAELEQLRRGRTGAVIVSESGTGETAVDSNQTPIALEGIGRDGSSCHFSLCSTVEIARDGGCRVAAYCESLNLVVVSQRSTNPLFPGFGVKKVDALEFRATQFVPAHPKPIRDLAFAPSGAARSLLLSASFDCTARLLDVAGGSNAVVATLSADTPLWSCCWDACDPNLLHVGTQGGVILSFDVRRTSAPVARKTDPDDITPVISLVPVLPSPGRSLPLGGLLSCHLSSCWAHDISTENSLRLPLEGPFTALRYEPSTQHFLVSARPCARTPHARHSVCERALRRPHRETVEDNVFSVCNPPVHTFLGGTSQRVLSRPCLVPVGRDLVVAAHQESSSTVALWSVGTGSRVATIPASDPVIDVCPVRVNRETHVALLTEKMLRLYKIH